MGNTNLLKGSSCHHLEADRMPLTNGKGFHCDACGENVHDQSESNTTSCVSPSADGPQQAEPETEKSSVSQTSGPRYKVVKANKQGNKVRWNVWGVAECKNIIRDGVQRFTKKNADRICDALNHVTVDAIPPVTGDEAKKLAKRQAEMERHNIEALATQVAEKYQQVLDLDQQRIALHRKASAVIKELWTEIKGVLNWFVSKAVNDKLFGLYGTQGEWTKAIFDMTPEGVKYHLKPKKAEPQPLLTAGESPVKPPVTPPVTDTDINPDKLPEVPEKQDSDIEDAEFTEGGSEEGEQKPTIPQLLADTKPLFAVGVSPADIVSNSVKDNSRLIINYARSFARMMTESEWQECVREVITGLQYELPDDEPTVQVRMNIVPAEGGSAAV